MKEKNTSFHPHYSRHTFILIQISKGVPITTIAALVGYTAETIYKTNAHSYGKDEIAASNIMDNIIALNSYDENKD